MAGYKSVHSSHVPKHHTIRDVWPTSLFFFLQEVNFYKIIDYLLEGKEEIKVIP